MKEKQTIYELIKILEIYEERDFFERLYTDLNETVSQEVIKENKLKIFNKLQLKEKSIDTYCA